MTDEMRSVARRRAGAGGSLVVYNDDDRKKARRALYERIAAANALADAETEARRVWDGSQSSPRYTHPR